MKFFPLKFLSYILVLTIISGGVSFYSPNLAIAVSPNNYISGEFLVKFTGVADTLKIKIDSSINVDEIIDTYSTRDDVEYIEPNYTFQATAFPTDPDFSLQYYLQMINAKAGWSNELLVREKENIYRKSVIAVLDTGVDLDHPDLKEKIWKNLDEVAGNNLDDDRNGFVDDRNGWDFIDGDNDANPSLQGSINQDAAKHGTLVAGIAAAQTNNNEGIAGLGWFVEIMPLRVLDSTGSGDVYSVAQAIDYAVANGADVINMSFIGEGYSAFLSEAIKRAHNAGVIVVAAAGNTDPGVNGINLSLTKSYPVCYDEDGVNMVIGVASVNSSFKKSRFSNYGECIDIVAPGESFYAAQIYEPSIQGFSKAYDGYWSGTSLSAPLVSGALAAAKALRPGFSNSQLGDFLMSSAFNVNSFNQEFSGQLGAGLLNFEEFINELLGSKEPVGPEGQVENYIAVGLGFKSIPQIKLFRPDGSEFKAFMSYNLGFDGSVNIAVGDVNGDGIKDVVTGAGAGGGPHVRIMNINGQAQSQFFAYEESFRGGINIAVGDMDGDGVDEIITGVDGGKAPQVQIFDSGGNLKNSFLAYGEDFLGGVKVAVGDVDGDGVNEIVTGAGSGGGPHVRVFNSNGQLKFQFFAYNQNFHGGINVAVGDINNNNKAEIVVSVESNSLPTVRIFNDKAVMISSFFAFDPNALNGVNLAVGDGDGDGVDEIITGKGLGGNSQIRAFNPNGILKYEFMAHLPDYRGGARPAVLE